MRQFIIGASIVLIAFLAVFFWLASQGSPDNAPQTPVVIDLPDTYEK